MASVDISLYKETISKTFTLVESIDEIANTMIYYSGHSMAYLQLGAINQEQYNEIEAFIEEKGRFHIELFLLY